MSTLPVVSIVGRPNVGKSSLFNRILHRRIAVVDDVPGVTRDRNYMQTSWNNQDFQIVDTGGLVPTSKESIPLEIHKQVEIAIQESSAIIFLVEAIPGPTDFDLLIAQQLRKKGQGRIILVANKAESNEASREVNHHMALGCGEPMPVSALHGQGVGDLLDRICDMLIKNVSKENALKNHIDLNITIIGRPNAGKSSIINRLLNDDRMIVDNVAGTTRDAIDSLMTYENNTIKLIDTAGLRKKSQVHDDVEYYSNLRALGSIKRCDICILLIDTANEISEQDLKIVDHIIKLKKGIILCWNKWDLVNKDSKTFDRLVADTKKTFRELQYTPMVSISALTGQRVTHVLDLALEIKERMAKKIGQSELKEQFFNWIRVNPHPFFSGKKQVRFLGIKQAKVDYPLINIFCSNPGNIIESYKRFLYNKIQGRYNFSGCPVIFNYKSAGHSEHHKEQILDHLENNID